MLALVGCVGGLFAVVALGFVSASSCGLVVVGLFGCVTVFGSEGLSWLVGLVYCVEVGLV